MERQSNLVSTPLLRIIAAVILGLLAFGQIRVHAATETARIVKYDQDDIVTVHAKLRYSTLIVLPENEEILDFTTGDKDFWIGVFLVKGVRTTSATSDFPGSASRRPRSPFCRPRRAFAAI